MAQRSGAAAQVPVSVVTGANRGVERSIALGFADAGGDVGVTACDPGALGAVVDDIERAGHGVLAVPGDITDEGSVEAMGDNVLVPERFGFVHPAVVRRLA